MDRTNHMESNDCRSRKNVIPIQILRIKRDGMHHLLSVLKTINHNLNICDKVNCGTTSANNQYHQVENKHNLNISLSRTLYWDNLKKKHTYHIMKSLPKSDHNDK
jgi:4-diphosphocytidyl-2C-methyl-D-erythritol kinase